MRRQPRRPPSCYCRIWSCQVASIHDPSIRCRNPCMLSPPIRAWGAICGLLRRLTHGASFGKRIRRRLERNRKFADSPLEGGGSWIRTSGSTPNWQRLAVAIQRDGRRRTVRAFLTGAPLPPTASPRFCRWWPSGSPALKPAQSPVSRTVSPASGTSGRKRIRERANGAVYTRCPGLTPTDWPNWVRPAACPSCRRVLLWQVERLSPLRTDSLPFVSKIYWPKNADDAIMDAP